MLGKEKFANAKQYNLAEWAYLDGDLDYDAYCLGYRYNQIAHFCKGSLRQTDSNAEPGEESGAHGILFPTLFRERA